MSKPQLEIDLLITYYSVPLLFIQSNKIGIDGTNNVTNHRAIVKSQKSPVRKGILNSRSHKENMASPRW